MTYLVSTRLRSAIQILLIASALLVCFASPALADKQSDARDQFARAVRLRTMLEGYLPRDRALSDYKETIAAYHTVYLISTQAPEVCPSLIAEAELYREMGRQFDPKYFQTAIDTYNFLLKQYPGTRYRGEVLFAIAQVQKDDQKNLDAATATLKDFLKRYPKNDKADDARAALQEIADAREKPKEAVAQTVVPAKEELPQQGPVVEPRESDKRFSSVNSIQTFDAADHARIVVTLGDTIKYDVNHLRSPDRIYFDLHKARIGPKLTKSLEMPDGLLKSVRVAQNRADVVRLVLDANGAKDCTAVLLGSPYRLVIDVHGQPPAGASNIAAPNAPAPPAETVTVTVEQPPAAPAKSSAQPEKTVAKSAPPKSLANSKTAALKPPPEPKPTRDGQRSLTRALGLKISRIVIDPGHGGHDTGTIGPHGLMEKDLCLDVALRLGHLIEQKLPGAEVIYTRKDDTFIPLEQRTAIANQAKADLFISIHANSSRDHDARGVETYYLNFATSQESMEVATRENAYSEKSLHDLQDLIQRIARNDKVEESKELASDIQDSLSHRLQLVSSSERNRGVKKAPFIVLIGANMPSVLSEISFVSNPSDERLLKKADQRDRIATGLYRGITTYLESLNSLSYNKQRLAADNPAADNPAATSVVANGNPK
ncbi:MAG TPA: N-acetylmuramoyl-L-alanine amidase [Candidatus Acidoferrum sp.]|nr:N-acetylmuramoyl-L-alanine amidase [Candidatus Acidoferrum sp.]